MSCFPYWHLHLHFPYFYFIFSTISLDIEELRTYRHIFLWNKERRREKCQWRVLPFRYSLVSCHCDYANGIFPLCLGIIFFSNIGTMTFFIAKNKKQAEHNIFQNKTSNKVFRYIHSIQTIWSERRVATNVQKISIGWKKIVSNFHPTMLVCAYPFPVDELYLKK